MQVLATAVLAGTVTPVTVIVVVPPFAVTVPPVQVCCTCGVAAIFNPDGRLSMKLTTCAGLLIGGLVTVKVSVEVPPSAIVVGLNALFRLGVVVDAMSALSLAALHAPETAALLASPL